MQSSKGWYGGQIMQDFGGQNLDLESDALSDRQPVEGVKYGGNMIKCLTAGGQAGHGSLYALQLANFRVW